MRRGKHIQDEYIIIITKTSHLVMHKTMLESVMKIAHRAR